MIKIQIRKIKKIKQCKLNIYVQDDEDNIKTFMHCKINISSKKFWDK